MSEKTHATRKKEFIEALESGIVSMEKAASEVGRSRSTIWRWRQEDEEFDERVEQAKRTQQEMRVSSVEDRVFKDVVSGDAPASVTIFWLKNKAGWTSKQTFEHTGSDGGPIRTEEVSEEDKQELEDYTAMFREEEREGVDSSA